MLPEVKLEYVDQIVARYGRGQDAVIPILQALQKQFRYLPDEALRRVCSISDVTPATVESVVSFFPLFRRTPAGEHTICVCDGTACHLKGAPDIYDAIVENLELGEHEDTDKNGVFTVKKVRCLGCCTLAPAVQIDEVTYGHVNTETVPRMLEEFLAHTAKPKHAVHAEGWNAPAAEAEIRINLDSCCVAGGSEDIREAIEEVITAFDLGVRIKRVSCVGMCHQVPMVEIVVPGQAPRMYAKVKPEDMLSIVLNHFPPHKTASKVRARTIRWLERLYSDEARDPVDRYVLDPAQAPMSTFLQKQERIATEHYGQNDPGDLEEYCRSGGFLALKRCLPEGETISCACEKAIPDTSIEPLSPEAIIEEIRNSGLRGRGGAGFPTARKWHEVGQAAGETKYLICNGDEGDPGAFMDRMILESYPYRVIEGMIIASVAVGAHKGIYYIRAEYPLAVARIRAALAICEKAGLLGERVMGSSHAFNAHVHEGAGAFVCGEETSLIASLEGRRPMPRPRPPYPAHQGLFGCPTLINNVETLAMVPWIIRNGADAFARMGTESSKGTKVFALAGKVQRGGLIEVPMGTTVQQIVEDIGGGVLPGRTLKAVQVGGPSGGCIPARLAHLPVDYEALTSAGSMMGSGGLVVLDNTDCMVEITRYFLAFTQTESCGKCTPCRVGANEMLEILNRLCEGSGTKEDLECLETLSKVVKEHSLCGLGHTAPNPVLTALAYFREEFEAHVEGRCLAHKCKAFLTYSITDDCIGCTKCAQHCPSEAIRMTPYEVHKIDLEKCVRCGVCLDVCPVHAVKVD
ncbi:MAG TPA: NAD(P)H-dependent oxidoreductase subunit E [Candidatus Hydrogenedentes bacterium]|nr:NAD(P)H-dependent oxidoreductase subunit E [Candidatus Hydrogenedentota bacterium]